MLHLQVVFLTALDGQDQEDRAAAPSPVSKPDPPGFRFNATSLLSFRHISSVTPPSKKFLIRSDPNLVTCFDPADKELYDVWVPNRYVE